MVARELPQVSFFICCQYNQSSVSLESVILYFFYYVIAMKSFIQCVRISKLDNYFLIGKFKCNGYVCILKICT